MQEHIIENLGAHIHYWTQTGDSDDWVFFLHGAGLNHHMFDSQFQAIPTHYNILAWDARGHGKSDIKPNLQINYRDMIDDVRAIFAQQQITSAIFIGQSMGGFLSQDVAYYYPELVKSMILMDCARNTDKLSKLDKLGLKLLPYLLNAQPAPLFLAKSAKMCGKMPTTIQFAYQSMTKMGKARIVETLTSLRQAFHEDTRYQSHCPMLLICGKQDKVSLVQKSMRKWHKHDRRASKTVWIKNAGHCANQDQPIAVNQAITNYFKTLN